MHVPRGTSLLVAVGLLAFQARADLVEQHDGGVTLTGHVLLVDDAGVRIRTDFGAMHHVAWDRVRRVVAEHPDPSLDQRMQVAMELWRARSRVERGDTTLAEPLFERLFERSEGQTHETALVVAEGLLRCRLARGAQADAVIPALEMIRLRRAAIETESYGALPSLYDEKTSLCTALAPVWLSRRSLARLSHDLEEYDAQDDEIVEALARLYAFAAARALDQRAPESALDALPQHPGVRLLRAVLQSGATDGDVRRGARQRLRQALEEFGPWAQAWAHYHLGLSLRGERDATSREAGLVHLAYLPARYGQDQPFLCGLALARLAQALDERGQGDEADSLRAELRRRFPHHPVQTVGLPPPTPLQNRNSP